MIHPLIKIRKSKKNNPPLLSGYKPSAVLVPLIPRRNRFHVLFTERTAIVRNHKNQISFPGGVREKRDRNLLETALRESQEEVGICPEEVKILAELGEIYTPTGYRITPYLGVVSPKCVFRPNPKEIRSLIEVPLSHLLKPKSCRIEPAEFFDSEFDSPFFYYKRHIIWGATGRITQELVDLVRKNKF